MFPVLYKYIHFREGFPIKNGIYQTIPAQYWISGIYRLPVICLVQKNEQSKPRFVIFTKNII